MRPRDAQGRGRRWLRALGVGATLVAAALVVGTTLLPLLEADAWWVRIFDFPRVQVAVLGAAALVCGAAILRRRKAWVLVPLAASVAYQVACIAPYTPVWPVETKDPERPDAPRLSVLIVNVLQKNREADAVLAQIAATDPDLVLAMETDDWWAERLAPVAKTHPTVLSAPLPNTYGMILYSRLRLERPEIRYIVQADVPSVHATVVLADGTRVRFHGVHPRPPIPGTAATPRDAELVLVGREVRAERAPAVVAGDLNDVAWSETTELFREVSGTLDPRRGRGLFPTFDAKNPLMRYPLDHLFHTPEFRLVAMDLRPEVGSDHFPVYVELTFEPEGAVEHESPAPEPEEREEAQEAVDKVR